MPNRFIRQPEVISRTGLSSSTIWRLELAGIFPARRRIGSNSVGWLEIEVDRWITSRPWALRKVDPKPENAPWECDNNAE